MFLLGFAGDMPIYFTAHIIPSDLPGDFLGCKHTIVVGVPTPKSIN